MSRWRINLGIGPIRYTRPIGRPTDQPKPKRTLLGALVTLLVTLAAIWLCCTGVVWWANRP